MAGPRRTHHDPIPGPDNPCPICGTAEHFDYGFIATRVKSTGENRFGRVYFCSNCGVMRYHDAPPPDWWQEGMHPGSESES